MNHTESALRGAAAKPPRCIDIVDFENFNFLVSQPIFTSVRASPAGQNGLSCNNEVSIHDHKIVKMLPLSQTATKYF